MSEPKLYLRHKTTGRRFEVLGVDRDTKTIKLKGELAVIEETYDPQYLKQLGYMMEKEET
jgi:hypothetical protein